MSALFQPLPLRGVTIRNRIGMSPMSMYSAKGGYVGPLDAVHYGARAIGGAGLVFTGTVAVSPEGRITPGDPGLWEDAQTDGLQNIATLIRMAGATSGIQIGHAGRKASTAIPWQGGEPKGEGRSLNDDEGGWPTLAPSSLAFGGNRTKLPHELTSGEIQRIIDDFVAASVRAKAAGFDVLELHGGHGYLLHSFYSPISNQRQDQYGGTFEERITFPLEVVRAVRAVWPSDRPLAFRLTMDDFLAGGWTVEEGAELARRLVGEGVDLLDLMSFGGIAAGCQVPWGSNFTAEHAKLLKAALPQTTVSVSAQTDSSYKTAPEAIAKLVDSRVSDLVLLGRQLLVEPHFPARAAGILGLEHAVLPANYEHWTTGRQSDFDFSSKDTEPR